MFKKMKSLFRNKKYINIEELHCIFSKKGINDLEESDVDKRRDSRTSLLLSILLVSGSIFTLLCKASLRFFRIYYFNNLTWYLLVFFSLSISIIIFLIYDIIKYMFYELLRNNVKNGKYNDYDGKADTAYYYLTKDLFFFTLIYIFLFLFFILSLPRKNGFFEIFQKAEIIIVIGFFFIVIILEFIKEKKEYKKFFINKFFITLIIALVVSAFIVSYFFVISGTLSVKNDIEGRVVISNSSNVKFGSLIISVYNGDEEKVYYNSVDKQDILFAEEEKYYNDNEDANKLIALDLEAGSYQWKYTLDLNDIIKENGKYKIMIDYTAKNKSTIIINYISLYDKEFMFGNDDITFNY